MLAVLLVGAFMPTLDFFIVNVAVPSITEDLHASSGETELVVAVYAIVYASLLVLGGRLGDHWGRERTFVVGLALFTATSAMCGFAPDVWWLICGRALQGGASVVLFPQVLALIRIHYPPAERPRVMRVYGLATGSAMALGQLLGGLLISLDWLGLSWRWAFLVNLPVGAVTLVLAPLLLPATGRRAGRLSFDRTGVVLFAGAMVLLVLPLTVGRSAGWPGWTLLMLAGAAAALPGFWLWERRTESLGRDPLLPPGLLRVRALRTGLLTVASFYASLSSFLYVLALLLQNGQGLTPLQAGLVSSPLALGFCVASMSSAYLTNRWGTRPLKAAMGVQIAGYAGQFLLLPDGAAAVNIPALAALLAVNGVCTGVVMAPLLGLVLDKVDSARAGAASGLLATTQQVAGAVGLSVIGIVFHGAGRNTALAPARIADGYRHGLLYLVLTSAATLAGLFLLTRVRDATRPAGAPDGDARRVSSRN
ncbi:MFS transporter [Streptomyces megasporus]|uniref:MFS transporter n=1 Tax=Streptomyces megasporus TaxID=44060 RepID=UPI00068CFE7A|nr:MFS transporter [Streptomyces megasporus]